YYFSSHDTAATETYSLSLHDALPILPRERRHPVMNCRDHGRGTKRDRAGKAEMMLRNADIESRPHQKPRFLARALRNGFGANRIRADKPGRPMLLRGADGNDNPARLPKIGLHF